MFHGVYTAIVTPFNGGKLDDEALNNLIQMQVRAGVDGIVPVGTTGESATVDYEEHVRILAHGQMRENADRLPDSRQLVVARQRNEHFVANAAYIHNRLRGQGIYEFTIKECDHGFVEALKR